VNLFAERLVVSGCATEPELFRRLEFWARRYGFELIANVAEGDFVFKRGSHWQAVYTFDIRKVPTQVEIRLIDEEHGICRCTMSCGSALQMTAPNDDRRLSEQMDLLEACLKEAIAGGPTESQPRGPDSELAPEPPSEEIQRFGDREL
jgi:hypothetical protein